MTRTDAPSAGRYSIIFTSFLIWARTVRKATRGRSLRVVLFLGYIYKAHIFDLRRFFT